MFTQWDQVEDWIKNNQLKKWIFTKNDRNNRSGEGGAPNDKIVDSEYLPGEIDQKLQLTKQALEQYGSRVYGYGFYGSKCTDGLYCEVCLQCSPSYPMQPSVGTLPAQSFDKEAFRKEIMNEIKLKQFEDERAEFEKDKRDFQKEKEGVVGMLIGYLAPIAQARLGKRVAGIDAPGEVVTDPVAPLHNSEKNEEQEQEQPSPFTDEEEEKVYDLMVRFKKAEPDYLQLLESVVAMAEAGDQTYNMAKGFLIK